MSIKNFELKRLIIVDDFKDKIVENTRENRKQNKKILNKRTLKFGCPFKVDLLTVIETTRKKLQLTFTFY